MNDLTPLIDSFMSFAQERLGFDRPPKLFFKQDSENAKDFFGKTAHYDPRSESVTVFVTDRHPKDIMRSLAHELVHHVQNLRGDLSPEKCGDLGPGYAQTNKHMREMERQAFEKGNLCFRDFCDQYKKQLQEVKFLKESKKMTKITRKTLEGIIRRILKESLKNERQQRKADRDPDSAGNQKMAQQQKDRGMTVRPVTEGEGESKIKELEKRIKERTKRLKTLKTHEQTPSKKRQISANERALAKDKQALAKLKDVNEGKSKKCAKCKNCGCKGKGCVKCDNCKDCNPVDKSKKVSEQMTSPDAPMSVDVKPDFPDVDGDGDTKEPISKASKEKKEKEGGKSEKTDKDMSKVPPQLRKHVEKNKKGQNESKIYTPEQEQSLYESRFDNRNDRIFDKLKKLWTK